MSYNLSSGGCQAFSVLGLSFSGYCSLPHVMEDQPQHVQFSIKTDFLGALCKTLQRPCLVKRSLFWYSAECIPATSTPQLWFLSPQLSGTAEIFLNFSSLVLKVLPGRKTRWFYNSLIFFLFLIAALPFLCSSGICILSGFLDVYSKTASLVPVTPSWPKPNSPTLKDSSPAEII